MSETSKIWQDALAEIEGAVLADVREILAKDMEKSAEILKPVTENIGRWAIKSVKDALVEGRRDLAEENLRMLKSQAAMVTAIVAQDTAASLKRFVEEVLPAVLRIVLRTLVAI